MADKRETLIDSFQSLTASQKVAAVAAGLAPVAMGFLSYQGLANHFYETTHTKLAQDGATYQLTGPAVVTQKKDGQTYKYDFEANTVHVSSAALKPQPVVTAGLPMFQTYSASRVRDQAGADAIVKPADPASVEQARAAGCSIADHLDTLSDEEAPIVGNAHSRIQARGRAFKAEFC